jgi:MFS family permease
MLFVGWAVASPFVMRLVDLFGRKRVYFVVMLLHALIYLAIILSKDLTLTIVLMFFLGTMTVGRASISYLYL